MHAILALATVISAQVQGTVVQRHSHWQGGLIVTDTTLYVNHVLSGDVLGVREIQVRTLGGQIDGIAQVAFGEDELPAGEFVTAQLVREGTTWRVAHSNDEHVAHASKTGDTPAGFVRATTAINQGCGGQEPIELHWPDGETHYVIDEHGPPGVDSHDAETAVRASFDAWGSVSCSYFKLTYDGTVEQAQVGYDAYHDNQNVVTWVENDWEGKSTTQAITLLTFGCSDGVVLDADILVNADDFAFTIDPEHDEDRKRDLQNVLTHEAGHLVGFAHSPDSESTMFATVTADETQKRDLTAADVEGMCEAYPVAIGPQDANSPALPGCSIAAAGANRESNRALAVALVLLALAGARVLKSRAHFTC